MSQNPVAAAGQVSADGQFRWDGQQWIPIPRGQREPTPWTRPMQLAVAGFFVLEALFSILIAILYINHDSMMRVLQSQGTQIPANTDLNTVINISIGAAYAGVAFIAILELVAALGSYLRWRWIFWAALVLLGFGAIGALTNIGSLTNPNASPVPVWGIVLNEVISIASLTLFVWMLIGAIRFGPWAMKRPGT